MSFIEKYQPYNKWLIETINLDWFKIREQYKLLGNEPGIYPDTAMLLCQTAIRSEVETIIELGSGTSTLFLEAIARKLNKKFISFEEEEKYLQLTLDLCRVYNYKPDIRLFKNWNLPDCDMIWIDSYKENRNAFWSNLKKTNKITWFIQDDSQNPQHLVPMIKNLSRLNYNNVIYFNGVSREDRVQLICNKDNKLFINKWIWDWKPDKVNW